MGTDGKGLLSRCQLKVLPEAVKPLPFFDVLSFWYKKKKGRSTQILRRVLSDPKVLLKKQLFLVGKKQNRFSPSIEKQLPGSSPASSALGLNLGELVRIKSYKDIEKTLDELGRFEGLAFMLSVMDKYCGGIYRVRKRINYFFDERQKQLMKLRNVVILDGVFCEVPKDESVDWAGCDRTCFLFWKEVWLERVSDNDPS